MKKKIFGIISIFLLVVVLTGCGSINIKVNNGKDENKVEEKKEKTKEYSLKGLHITMADDMVESSVVGYTSYLQGVDYSFASVKESFEDYKAAQLEIDETSSVEDYMKFIAKVNQVDTEVIEKDNLVYIKYTKTVGGNDYYYMAFAYKSDDSFWLVNLFCFDKDKEKYEPIFIKWAKTVTFD